MERSVQTQTPNIRVSTFQEAWEMVLNQLRLEMSKAQFETWVLSLRPLGYQDHIFTIRAFNPYARDWVAGHLDSRISHLLEGLFNEPVNIQVVVPEEQPAEAVQGQNESTAGEPEPSAERPNPASAGPNRKIMLQRAYGSERARVIQPERGMFLTSYFFNNWLPELGHSGATTVLAARSLCYWNPMTGELRNTIETDMSELAKRAAVSVRTVKDVLNNDLVKHYFLRYKVRRMMTPNGIRTAGIILQVRMDDPLTPEDQASYNLPEDERWYSADFEDESEE
ncbi:MAG: DnaA N-terminal domain-containing protein [Anaerolineaceae bacterium]|nr:DnaA N-terminal domain-containing protein [Anaerolineaceae bacterium]